MYNLRVHLDYSYHQSVVPLLLFFFFSKDNYFALTMTRHIRHINL